MSLNSYQTILWIVVVWPLLLAIPALHSRLPWPRHLALLPAVILLLFASNTTLELPWLLFGTGFAIDGNNRWILAMTIIIWLMAASVDKILHHNSDDKQTSTLFLLTLAGNLGALLSTELVGFFCFSTIMGYGFYSLVMDGDHAAIRRAGRLYLIFLVLADLALFEALLLAAYSTDNLHYLSVRQAMAGTGSAQFYFWIAFVGFAFKAGIWPAHVWLSATYRSAAVSRTLLLAGVPVTMALLGMLRWLAFDEHGFSIEGIILQILGGLTVLFAALRLMISRNIKELPEWLCITGTGLFITALGAGLIHPELWPQYTYLGYLLLAAWSTLLAALSLILSRSTDLKQTSPYTAQLENTFSGWTGNWIPRFNHWTKEVIHKLAFICSNPQQMILKQSQVIRQQLIQRIYFTGWSTRITLFVLLGLAVAWLGG